MGNGFGLMKPSRPGWRHIQSVITAIMMLVALTACGQSDAGSISGNTVERANRTVHIRNVHEALAKNDISGAEWAWHYANVAGLRSGSWKSMIEVGDAALCIGKAAGFRQGSADRARESYFVALIRARLQQSNGGLRRTAQAFAALGDGEAVDQCLLIAKSLPTGPPVTRVDVSSVLNTENP